MSEGGLGSLPVSILNYVSRLNYSSTLFVDVWLSLWIHINDRSTLEHPKVKYLKLLCILSMAM